MEEHKNHYQDFTENFNKTSNNLETNIDQDNNNQLNESFLITFFNNKLTAVKLHIDYQFRGLALCNICLYDYASCIQKTTINSYKLMMLTEEHSREENDRFFFKGNELN